MTFKIPNQDLPADHIRPEIKALAERPEPITMHEWDLLRLNSYERDALVGNLDDEVLAWCVRHAIDNSTRRQSHRCTTTYDEAVIHLYAPELLRRLERKRQ